MSKSRVRQVLGVLGVVSFVGLYLWFVLMPAQPTQPVSTESFDGAPLLITVGYIILSAIGVIAMIFDHKAVPFNLFAIIAWLMVPAYLSTGLYHSTDNYVKTANDWLAYPFAFWLPFLFILDFVVFWGWPKVTRY